MDESSEFSHLKAALATAAKQQWRVLAGVTLGGLVVLVSQSRWPVEFGSLWTVLDPLLSIVTLGTAVLVWIAEARHNWEQTLPVRLTVTFDFEGTPVLTCEQAPLLPGDSARAMGQQIGKQLNRGHELKFKPFPKLLSAEPEQVDGGWVKHMRIRFELVAKPSQLSDVKLPIVTGPPDFEGFSAD